MTLPDPRCINKLTATILWMISRSNAVGDSDNSWAKKVSKWRQILLPFSFPPTSNLLEGGGGFARTRTEKNYQAVTTKPDVNGCSLSRALAKLRMQSF